MMRPPETLTVLLCTINADYVHSSIKMLFLYVAKLEIVMQPLVREVRQ
jgi:hypothetical protein